MKKNILLITADDLNYNTIGCFGGKVDDITPNLDHLASEGMCFDRYIYYRDCTEFFKQVKENGKPFFFMVNSHDPHRPFAGSEDELRIFYGYNTYASRYYKPEEIEVPGFLPDIPDVRKELAQYYSSVHRLDETVGGALRALDEAGLVDSTLIVFLSDNGMAFPFSKANCYLNSTKTPFIVRWPGVIAGGTRNKEDYIAGIDFTPTILEYAGLKDAVLCDGRSYLPLLKGEKQADRDVVFTQFNLTAMNRSYPMRCIQSRDFGYIFNAWSDGKTLFVNESKMGLTYKAMRASKNIKVTERADFFDYRCKEEFYDFKKDPDGLNNLMEDPAYARRIEEYKSRLLKYMIDTTDPVREAYQKECGGRI